MTSISAIRKKVLGEWVLEISRKNKPMIEVIGMATLLGYLQGSIAKMKDPRKPSPNKQYSIFDVVLSAFGVFFIENFGSETPS